jgi:phosphatidylglycerol:prolipoprotein diacylglycerol transferase
MVTFHLYGFFVGLGIVAGCFVIEKVNKKFIIYNSKFIIQDIFFWILIPGLIGARLYHVLDYWQYYWSNPVEILYLWQGGLGIYGAIVGGVIGLWVFLKFKMKKSKCKMTMQNAKLWEIFLTYLDIISFGLPVGQAVGRLGNYFNQELYGWPTKLPWGIYINPKNRIADYEGFEYFQPLFAYESVWDILIFIILIRLITFIKKPKPGIFFFAYLGLYGFGRFWLEFLRINPWQVRGVNVAQGISIVMIVISLWRLFLNRLFKLVK